MCKTNTLSPLALLSLAACGSNTSGVLGLKESSPLKILALHGGGETGASFSSQAGMVSLINNLPGFEFVFANAAKEATFATFAYKLNLVVKSVFD